MSAYAGPTTWNSLPGDLGNVNLSLSTFKPQDLSFSLVTRALSAVEVFYRNTLHEFTVIFITSAKEDCNRHCLSVCLSATLHKNVRRDLHESFRKVANGPMNNV